MVASRSHPAPRPCSWSPTAAIPIHEIENTLAAIRRAHPTAPRSSRSISGARPTGSACCCTTRPPLRMWGVDRPVREQRTAELAPGDPAAARRPRGRRACSALLLDIPDDGPDPRSRTRPWRHRPCRARSRCVRSCPVLLRRVTAMQRRACADPAVEIRLTWKVSSLSLTNLVELRPRSWNPPHELVDAASIVWPVPTGSRSPAGRWMTPDRAEELAVLGVDAITSNRAGALSARAEGSARGPGRRRRPWPGEPPPGGCVVGLMAVSMRGDAISRGCRDLP